jgi:hypothetical protein
VLGFANLQASFRLDARARRIAGIPRRD